MATFRKFNFEETVKALEKQKPLLPQQIANLAVKHFVSSFTNEGFSDNGVKKWKEVKRRIPGTPEYKYPKDRDTARRTRAILLGRGSHQLFKEVNNSFRSASWEGIKLGISDAAPYAVYHNEGTDKLPKRKFMGHSALLENQIREKLRKGILSSLKK